MRRLLAGIAIAIMVVLGVATMALLLVDVAAFEPRLERLASSALGRPVEVRGPLRLDRGGVLGLHAGDVAIGGDSSGSHLATARSVEVRLDLPRSLAAWQIVLPEVRIAGAEIDLAAADLPADPAGRAGKNAAEHGAPWVSLRRLVVSDARISYHGGTKSEAPVDLEVSRLTAELAPARNSIRVEGEGRLGELPATLEASLGSGSITATGRGPLALEGILSVGGSTLRVGGEIAEAATLGGVDLAFRLSSDRPARPLRQVGLDVVALPPVEVEGRLRRDDRVWRLADTAGRVGPVPFDANLRLDLAGVRPALSGEIAVDAIGGEALEGWIGAGEGAAGSKVLPAVPLVGWRDAVDLDLAVSAQSLNLGSMTLRSIGVDLRLDGGHFTVADLAVDVAGGSASGTISVEDGDRLPLASADLQAHSIGLGPMLALFGQGEQAAGELAARLELRGSGNDLQAAFAGAHGRLTTSVQQAEVSAALVNAIGLDLIDIFSALFTGDAVADARGRVRVPCLVADIRAEAGVARVETLVLETARTVIVGDGTIDLATEELALTLRGQPKQPGLFESKAPVRIGGTLQAPEVSPAVGTALVQGAIGATLGTALAPLIAAGSFLAGDGSGEVPCASLVDLADDEP